MTTAATGTAPDPAVALVPADAGDPLIRLAIDKDLDVEKLEKLISLKRDQDALVAAR